MNNNVKRCNKCILSANFPRISFNSKGICNFCSNKMFTLTNKDVIESASKHARELFNKVKKTSGYHAVICFSGGKDSTYTMLRAVKKYNLNVLAITFDNGFLSETTFKNIKQVVDNLGVDHLLIRYSINNLKNIFKASVLNPIYNKKTLTRISSGCNSCISMINNMALKLALEKNIPFIIAGFNIGQIPANSIIFKNNYLFLKESRETILNKLKVHIAPDIIDKYFCIEKQIIDNVKQYPYTINLLCLENITEEEILKRINKIGWKSPQDVDGCSSNCRLNSFNNFAHSKALGYNPYELELSHLIRQGLLSRKEALNKIFKQPEEQIIEIQKELKITDKEIEQINNIY